MKIGKYGLSFSNELILALLRLFDFDNEISFRKNLLWSRADFGTGLSSFAYLKLFPVDTLKIDGSFVRDLVENEVSQSVVAAIAEVARVMKLETVAEYVQTDEALEILRKLGYVE